MRGTLDTLMKLEQYTKAISHTLPACWLLQVACCFLGAQPAAAMPLAIPAPCMVHAARALPIRNSSHPSVIPATRVMDRRPAPPVSLSKASTVTASKFVPAQRSAARGQSRKPSAANAPALTARALAPGLVHKRNHGRLLINVLDVDLAPANIQVVPVLAGDSFNKLDVVARQAQKVKALAAINANYFKHDGTPLGVLVMNGEWVAGPIYNRTAMGITADGRVLVDRVSLWGTLQTSNPEIASVRVDNINQPRIHGSGLIVYTRRWGTSVRMPYAGAMIAVDANARVVAKAESALEIPSGGFVLSDRKASNIAKLQVGDRVHLSWHVSPESWQDVVQAVSGGPMLIRDGNIDVDCRSEKFPTSWSGNGIKARTAVGVTSDRHLIMLTVEGKHSIYDVARLLQSLGAVQALNLDGGGSTTMVVAGRTVTRNKTGSQRCVATALALVRGHESPACSPKTTDTPAASLPDFVAQTVPDQGSLKPSAATQSHFYLLSWTGVMPELGRKSNTTDIITLENTLEDTATQISKKKGYKVMRSERDA